MKHDKTGVVKKNGTPSPPTDYSVYKPGKQERIACSAAGFLLGVLTGYTFYENLPVTLIASVFGIVAANRYYVRIRKESRRKKLILQFRDMLESLSTSIGAGSNIPDSFAAAAEDMEIRHGAESLIVGELGRINAGLSAGMSIEKLLREFGERSGIDDIRVFAAVFETCYRLGGNIRDIVNMTCRTICEKLDIRREILTAVSAKKSEQNAMLVMPVVFTVLLKCMGAGVADMASASGVFSTTAALLLFAVAYLAGRRILSIEP